MASLSLGLVCDDLLMSSFLFVLLSKKRDVSRILDADFVANAKVQSPSSKLESVVVDTGLAYPYIVHDIQFNQSQN